MKRKWEISVNNLPPVDIIFIDPDWAVTGPEHICRSICSNTHLPCVHLVLYDISNNGE
ncbi:MAG: hypothetical protein ACYS6K_23995 [Planctomycetota bacterium]